jgi:very-short-patch-repair endonuclease
LQDDKPTQKNRGIESAVAPHNPRVAHSLRTHDALILRRDALALGMTAAEVRTFLETGKWDREHWDVYRATDAPRTDRQRLRAACFGGGDAAVASHASAAWLWALVDKAPDRPEITVPTSRIPKLQGVRVHRSCDLAASRVVRKAGIPATDALRTLVDLGAVVTPTTLTHALDRALAMRLVTVEALVVELNRLSRQGRPGPKGLRQVLADRGHIGAPSPSVLESHMLRLMVKHNLLIPSIEVVVGPNGEYRLDFADVPIKLAIEVDGYAWHSNPDQLRRDHRRRNRLHADGWHTLVFTWADVTAHPDEVAAEIRAMRRKLGVE